VHRISHPWWVDDFHAVEHVPDIAPAVVVDGPGCVFARKASPRSHIPTRFPDGDTLHFCFVRMNVPSRSANSSWDQPARSRACRRAGFGGYLATSRCIPIDDHACTK
jgi:hypothetical protein